MHEHNSGIHILTYVCAHSTVSAYACISLLHCDRLYSRLFYVYMYIHIYVCMYVMYIHKYIHIYPGDEVGPPSSPHIHI